MNGSIGETIRTTRSIFLKKLTALIFAAALTCTALFADENLFSISMGLASGIPVYGTDSIISDGKEIDKPNRVIIGTTTSFNLNLIKQVTFFTGGDTLFDFVWDSKQYANKIHVSFPLGLKIYPGIGGFNAGLAYTLGFRIDSINTTEHEHEGISTWGNGFRLSLEYNFAHEGNSRFLPSIGGYWNLMPRGNKSYDNLIVLYIAANF